MPNEPRSATHGIDECFNAGWDDDPAWKVICACAWETWNHASEVSARERHSEHHAEVLLTGSCGCGSCETGAAA